jgi:hypothetical protein
MSPILHCHFVKIRVKWSELDDQSIHTFLNLRHARFSYYCLSFTVSKSNPTVSISLVHSLLRCTFTLTLTDRSSSPTRSAREDQADWLRYPATQISRLVPRLGPNLLQWCRPRKLARHVTLLALSLFKSCQEHHVPCSTFS